MEVRRGPCRAHVELPEQPGKRGVLILHEVYGVNEDMRRIAQRFAREGYVAVVPLLFGGPRCLARTLKTEARRQELDGWREWMRDHHGVEHAGIIGFCLGGGFALAQAAGGSDFEAASVNYGAVPVKDLSGICPVVGSYGDRDQIMLPEARKLVQLLDQAGVEHDVKVYPGVGHSFMNQHEGWQRALSSVPSPMRVGHDQAAAEDAWRRVFSFFDSHLA